MSKRRRVAQATIPQPAPDVHSLLATVLALKELVETLAGQRGAPSDAAATWGDLEFAGVVQPEQVPTDLG